MDYTTIELLTVVSMVLSVIALIISICFNIFFARTSQVNKFIDYVIEIDKMIIACPELYFMYCDDEEINNRKGDKLFMNKMAGFAFYHINVFESAWLQFLKGKHQLSKPQKKLWESFIISLFKTKYFADFWRLNNNIYDQDFVKHIDSLVKLSIASLSPTHNAGGDSVTLDVTE